MRFAARVCRFPALLTGGHGLFVVELVARAFGLRRTPASAGNFPSPLGTHRREAARLVGLVGHCRGLH
jgi:hypothetical protein